MPVPSFIRIEEVQMGAYYFKLKKVPLFARKPVNINVSRSAAPKLALVPASRYYCDVNLSNLNVCAKCHYIERVLEGGHDFILKKVPLFAQKPVHIKMFRYETQKLALVPANRYYCDIK